MLIQYLVSTNASEKKDFAQQIRGAIGYLMLIVYKHIDMRVSPNFTLLRILLKLIVYILLPYLESIERFKRKQRYCRFKKESSSSWQSIPERDHI